VFLDERTFSTVLESTPLVSIDLIIKNENNKYLLGKRINRPAKGYWFVPGGRILKNETLKAAFERLTQAEIGKCYSIECARLIGPYDHIYTDSVLGDQISTHYVAIAYEFEVEKLETLPINQHSSYSWMTAGQILSSENVHRNTKAYFK
jgi:colanic acid biosynthesis protein WcaH